MPLVGFAQQVVKGTAASSTASLGDLMATTDLQPALRTALSEFGMPRLEHAWRLAGAMFLLCVPCLGHQEVLALPRVATTKRRGFGTSKLVPALPFVQGTAAECLQCRGIATADACAWLLEAMTGL